MLLAILSICSEEELEESDSSGEEGVDENGHRRVNVSGGEMTAADYAHRRQQIKNKIMAVGRMQRVFQLLRCVLASLHLYYPAIVSFATLHLHLWYIFDVYLSHCPPSLFPFFVAYISLFLSPQPLPIPATQHLLIYALSTSTYREESEAASELVAAHPESDSTHPASSPGALGGRVGPDALNVQGTQISRNIRSFDDA